MSGLRFLGDIPIGRATIALLNDLGHDAIRAVDRLPPTARDQELVQLAVRENRIVLCFDLDLAALVAGSGSSFPSVITFRTRRRRAEFISNLLRISLPAIHADLVRGALVTIDDAGVRIRRLPVYDASGPGESGTVEGG